VVEYFHKTSSPKATAGIHSATAATITHCFFNPERKDILGLRLGSAHHKRSIRDAPWEWRKWSLNMSSTGLRLSAIQADAYAVYDYLSALPSILTLALSTPTGKLLWKFAAGREGQKPIYCPF
jgi:hypothetical protein